MALGKRVNPLNKVTRMRVPHRRVRLTGTQETSFEYPTRFGIPEGVKGYGGSGKIE